MISISEYLITNNVQLGATYSTSRTSTAKFDEAYRIASQYINAGIDEIGKADAVIQEN